MKKIQAISRGKDKGTILSPHFYTEGYFKITKGRKSDDHNRRVFSEHELESWVQKGYGIRMSARGHPPSTFMPQSLVIIA